MEGLVAIVTGAGSLGDGIGNGRASAILLAEAGASVVCVDLDQASAEHTVEMIEQEGKGKAISFGADVTKEDECKKAIELAISTYGKLHM